MEVAHTVHEFSLLRVRILTKDHLDLPLRRQNFLDEDICVPVASDQGLRLNL